MPQFVLDEHLSHATPCRIVVTEQRRVAAVEIAKRVASERGERLSETGCASVGYAVRDDLLHVVCLAELKWIEIRIY